jgi:hypothetical protein
MADTGLSFVYKAVDAAGGFAGVTPNEEAGSRLFVGNLTMHSDASKEVLVFSQEDAVSVPDVQKGAWIADVTYDEPSSAPGGGTSSAWDWEVEAETSWTKGGGTSSKSTESLTIVDSSAPSNDLYYSAFVVPTDTSHLDGNTVVMEKIVIAHEGFDLLI